MRSVQYIGITDDANEWLKAINAQVVEHFILHEDIYGDDEIIGRKWEANTDNSKYLITENVQDVPWSSGPMIFSNLRVKLVNQSGQTFDMGDYFVWSINPMVDEYDQQKGQYYV